MYEIIDSTNIARNGSGTVANMPFNELDVGKSFIVRDDVIKETTLRSRCSVIGKKLGKKFRCVSHVHNDENGNPVTYYEVARLR